MSRTEINEGVRRLCIVIGVLGCIGWFVLLVAATEGNLDQLFTDKVYSLPDPTQTITQGKTDKGIYDDILNAPVQYKFNFKKIFVALIGFPITFFVPFYSGRGIYWVYNGFKTTA